MVFGLQLGAYSDDQLHLHRYECMHACMCTYACMYVYVYRYVYIYIYICERLRGWIRIDTDICRDMCIHTYRYGYRYRC